ncbi:hypothetical protein ACFX2J_019882 [Malus domestica]
MSAQELKRSVICSSERGNSIAAELSSGLRFVISLATSAAQSCGGLSLTLTELCKPKCVKPLLEYQACVKRIQGDETGHKHCTGQYFDFWSCIDKCVAPKLFQKLK